MDYKQLFGQLQTAMKDYTSGAFEGYDPEDVKGLVKDRHDATVSYFEEVYDAVEELCEGVEEPRERSSTSIISVVFLDSLRRATRFMHA